MRKIKISVVVAFAVFALLLSSAGAAYTADDLANSLYSGWSSSGGGTYGSWYNVALYWLHSLGTSVDNIESDVDTIRSDLATVKSNTNNISSNSDNIESDVDTIRSDLATIKTNTNNLSTILTRLTSINSSIGNIESDVGYIVPTFDSI